MKEVVFFISCEPFLDAKMSLFAYNSLTILPRDVFSCVAGFLWPDLLCIREKTRQILLDNTKGKDSSTFGEKKEHMESREILCVHLPNTLNASSVQGPKILKEWIQFLWSNVVDLLFVAKHQSTNDLKLQTLGLDQLALIREPTVF